MSRSHTKHFIRHAAFKSGTTKFKKRYAQKIFKNKIKKYDGIVKSKSFFKKFLPWWDIRGDCSRTPGTWKMWAESLQDYSKESWNRWRKMYYSK